MIYLCSHDKAKTLDIDHKRIYSISGWAPPFWTDEGYQREIRLAPKKWIYDEYKKDGRVDLYSIRYTIEVLNKLNPKIILSQLATDPYLCCYEDWEFCHRHLVGEWFRLTLGEKIITL